MFSSATRIVRSELGRKFLASLLGTVFLAIASIVAVALFVFSTALERKDRELIELKSTEIAVRYASEGMRALQRPEVWVFVRLVSPEGAILFQRAPLGERDFDLSLLRPNEPEGAAKRARSWFTLGKGGDEDAYEVLSIRLADGNRLQVGKSSDDRDARVAFLLEILGMVSIPILVIVAFAGIWLVDRLFVPVRAFTATLEKLSAEDISLRVPTRSRNDELGRLITLFNGLLDRIETLIVDLRDTVNLVSHDLRTPLTRFRIAAERALSHAGDDTTADRLGAYRDAVAEGLESSERMLSMVDQILDITRTEAGATPRGDRNIDLAEVGRTVVELYQDSADEKRIALRSDFGSAVLPQGNSVQILRMAANLVDNAIKYTRAGGSVEIRTGTAEDAPWIDVVDTGIGISTEDLPRIWNRLFRGDRVRGTDGFGLGLSSVRAIVKANRGAVRIESRLETGTAIRITFPRV